MTFQKDRIILVAIIAAAFGLRIWGLAFGLPFQAHQDEPIVVNHALAYGLGDLNPHFFYIPPFTSYILFAVYALFFAAGKLTGEWASTGDFAASFFVDPSIFYLIGRFFIGVIPGVICVLLTYRLAARLFSERASLYASCVMALAYLNVANSHYIYTDMLLVTFILASYIAFFRLYDRPSLLNHFVSGLAIGLAAGAKYNGIFLVFTYLVASVLSARREGRSVFGRQNIAGALAAGSLALIAFFAVNPFSVFDLRGFLGSFLQQSKAFWYTGLGHHFFYSLAEGISLPLSLLGLAGLISLAMAGDRGKIFISFPIVFYSVLVFRSQDFARYVLPLVPFFAIGAAYFVFHVFPHFVKVPSVRRTAWAIAVVLILPTAVKSIKADTIFSSADTRIKAAEWIGKNLAPGTRIACDSTIFRPALKQPYVQLEEKERSLANQRGLADLKGRKLELMRKAADKNEKGYPLYFIFPEPAAQGQFLDTLPAVPFDLAVLKKEDIEYVVVNGQYRSSVEKEFLKILELQASIFKDFSPYLDGEYRDSSDTVDATCIPVSGRELFSRASSGPALRIYKIK
jgi:4-amino-4-deoxy-L-arabinose transferase-like glycosyltransferase